MGAAMGAGVGLTIGFIFGSYSIMRSVAVLSTNNNTRLNVPYAHRGGAGPRGILPTLSQYMLSSGATFAFFLSIGSVSAPSDMYFTANDEDVSGNSQRCTTSAQLGGSAITTRLSCPSFPIGGRTDDEGPLGTGEKTAENRLVIPTDTVTEHNTKVSRKSFAESRGTHAILGECGPSSVLLRTTVGYLGIFTITYIPVLPATRFNIISYVFLSSSSRENSG